MTTLKELHEDNCGQVRRWEVRKWKAYIVWELISIKLTRISEFFNSTNHLNHVVPMWSNQIVPRRKIWITNVWPIDKKEEGKAWRNGAVYKPKAYTISF